MLTAKLINIRHHSVLLIVICNRVGIKKDLQAQARRSLNLKRVNEEKLDQQSHPSKVIEF